MSLLRISNDVKSIGVVNACRIRLRQLRRVNPLLYVARRIIEIATMIGAQRLYHHAVLAMVNQTDGHYLHGVAIQGIELIAFGPLVADIDTTTMGVVGLIAEAWVGASHEEQG
jgi:hypothetical protein